MTNKPANGPDPEVQAAIQRLTQTQLSPLEEQLFQSWMKAHQMEGDGQNGSFDFRKLYQQTGGKIMPPDQLKKMVDINSIMEAQKAHDASSPIQQLMGGSSAPSSSPLPSDGGMPTGGSGMPPMGGMNG